MQDIRKKKRRASLFFSFFFKTFEKTFQKDLIFAKECAIIPKSTKYRGIVQSVEHQSPKLSVVGSSPSAPAKKKAIRESGWLFSVKSADGGRNPPAVDEIASR